MTGPPTQTPVKSARPGWVHNPRRRRDLICGLAFLAPNIVGFLTFTLFPLLFAFVLAFTNWDLRLHNMFKNEPLRFAGFEQFGRLLNEKYFWKYLGNTLFLMMGIPVGIAGSLCAALLLSADSLSGRRVPGRKRDTRRILVLGTVGASAVFALGLLLLFAAGAPLTGMTVLVGALCCGILVAGTGGGRTVYRTLFYLPHFCSGVAVFILWKKLYSPHAGPINNTLGPILSAFGRAVASVPAGPVQAGLWACAMLMPVLACLGGGRLYRSWRDGEMGTGALVAGAILIGVPACLAPAWSTRPAAGWCTLGATALVIAAYVGLILHRERGRSRSAARLSSPKSADAGLGHALILCTALMAAEFALLGIGNVLYHLPAMARSEAGLTPPEWLTRYHWAKPSIMIMGLWAAVGSNNMLLYLAGLSNIPQELHEAADVDGASRVQRFWHVTWPQLAPVTFFIAIMSVIHGLQGGFEMARTMTGGGPDGATTTLSYFVYVEGFETGKLGYASAISWALFALVFAVTLFNWKFGNRYVND